MSAGADDDPRRSADDGSVLGPRGPMARALPHYEDRPEQRAMASAISRSLADERSLIVEAGTGTGKTLAYLVPALTSGRRVIVSTGTRTLQEQIARHDLPLLSELLGREVSAVVLKGVSNYLCKRRLHELGARGLAGLAELASPSGRGAGRDDDLGRSDADDDTDSRAYERLSGELDSLRAWARHSPTGDRAEVSEVAETSPLWPAVTTTPDRRLGARCPYFETCFVTQARRRAEQADLVLVNHHLYFADLALRASAPGAKVLPAHDAVIFDEAHQLEDVITEHFGIRVSSLRVNQIARDAEIALDAAGRRASATPLSSHLDAPTRILAHLGRCADAFFALVSRHLRETAAAAQSDSGRVLIGPELFAAPDRQEAWFRLDTALDELASHAARAAERVSSDEPDNTRRAGRGSDAGTARTPERDSRDDDRREAILTVARRASALREDLAVLAEQSEHRHVYWGELRGAGVTLCASPVQVADIVRRHILAAIPTAIFTSATLAAAGGFGYARARLGLDEDRVDELRVDSPFDYARQALLYLPRDLPAPADPGFNAAACARITELLAITAGRAFVLFTSHRALRDASARLAAAGLPWPLLVQGREPRGVLIERFRSTPGAVLLATGAFWEGVDVPGDALSLVIIDKLPFAPHTDPLIDARRRHVEAEGGDAFTLLQLPHAALALKQGFGRLIRRRDDRGIVAVLDGRIVTKSYGRAFLETLPPRLPRTSALEQVRRWFSAPTQPPTTTTPPRPATPGTPRLERP